MEFTRVESRRGAAGRTASLEVDVEGPAALESASFTHRFGRFFGSVVRTKRYERSLESFLSESFLSDSQRSFAFSRCEETCSALRSIALWSWGLAF